VQGLFTTTCHMLTAKFIIAITENQVTVTTHVAWRKQSINNGLTLEHSRPDSSPESNRIPEVLIAQLDYLGCNPAARSGYHTVSKSGIFSYVTGGYHIGTFTRNGSTSLCRKSLSHENGRSAPHFLLCRAALSGQDGFISAPFRKLFDGIK
jgi:hypothetical protein